MSFLANVAEVGGNGGGPFEFNGTMNGATLKSILVWVGDWQVKAIKVSLTDGQTSQFGVPAGNSVEFIFKDGEHFTSLSLWPNGDASRLGAIKFKTNHSREFFVKMVQPLLKPEVSVDVASGICIGLKGKSGLDIDRAGFIFINTIKSTELKDVDYPTLSNVVPKVDFREIKSMSYQNNTIETQEYTIETSKKITQTSSWSVTGKVELTLFLQVKAGIPLLVESKGRYELRLGVEGTYASETTEVKMERYLFAVKVNAEKNVDVDITIGQAKIDLPFKGTVKITCYNGGVLEYKTSGTYKGVTFTGGDVVVTESRKKQDGAS